MEKECINDTRNGFVVNVYAGGNQIAATINNYGNASEKQEARCKKQESGDDDGSMFNVHELLSEREKCSMFNAQRSILNALTPYLSRAQAKGWLDDDLRPTVSRAKAALIADRIAECAGVRNKWKTFETLWGMKNLRADYNKALYQKQFYEFDTELKSVIY